MFLYRSILQVEFVWQFDIFVFIVEDLLRIIIVEVFNVQRISIKIHYSEIKYGYRNRSTEWYRYIINNTQKLFLDIRVTYVTYYLLPTSYYDENFMFHRHLKITQATSSNTYLEL